jgi:predicted O-linked N-acetylglucosamine transferase (SPINDLY family)
MGVPVITLAGAGMVGSLSSSILSSAGQEEWIAANEEAYVEIAKLLAMEGVRLKEKRIALRKKVLASALCDGKRLSCELERIYWEACCATAVE